MRLLATVVIQPHCKKGMSHEILFLFHGIINLLARLLQRMRTEKMRRQDLRIFSTFGILRISLLLPCLIVVNLVYYIPKPYIQKYNEWYEISK